MIIKVNDRATYAIESSREYTDEGFLLVPGRAARTGIQDYLPQELGLNGSSAVKIYRPSEEVFKDTSLSSYALADVTLEHPQTMVDSSTYKQSSVGTVKGSATKDGDFVLCDLVIKDSTAIKAVESGKVQLSAGYTAEYDMTPGTTDSGEAYDGIQRNIKINHVAIVSNARAGAQARIFDNKTETKEVQMLKLTLDSGKTVELESGDTATLINDSIERLNQSIKEKQDTIDALEAKTSDAHIDQLVALVTDAKLAAKELAGDDFTCDSVNITDIQAKALQTVDSSLSLKDKSADYVQGIFDAKKAEMFKKKKEDEELEEEEKTDKKSAKDSHTQLAKDLATSDSKPKESSYAAFKERSANAWKGGNK